MSPPTQPLPYRPVPPLDPNRHLQLIKGVLHDVIRIPLIHAFHDGIDVGHERVGDEEEFGSGVGLETG